MQLILKTLKLKWAEYFLEIVVIVIGIIIAYSLNNWNESRKERKEELKYLTNLKSDLSEDLTQIDFMTEFRNNKFTSAQKLLNYQDNGIITEQNEFFNHLITVLIWLEFAPNKNTMNELINSGNLSLIKNDTIKNSILKLNQLHEKIVTNREHMRREYDHYLYDRLGLYIDINDYTKLELFEISLTWQIDSISVKIKEKKLKRKASQFLSEPIVRNGLFLAAANNHIIVSQYKTLKNEISELMNVIDKEILNE